MNISNKTTFSIVLILLSIIGLVAFTSPVAAQTSQDTVSIDGSEITLNTGGGSSYSVSGIPDKVESFSSESGTVNAQEGSILWFPADDTESFNLRPGANYSDGDTIEFEAGDSTVSLTVSSDETQIKTDSVSPSGTPVEISVGDRTSFSVSGLPDNVSVSSANGDVGSDNNVTWQNPSKTVMFILTPGDGYTGGETIDFVAGDSFVSLDVIDAELKTDVVDASGSEVIVSAITGSSFAVDGLPDDINISSEDGNVSEDTNSVLWFSPGETVSFTLTPSSGYSGGDRIIFNIAETPVVVDVVDPEVPEEAADEVSSGQYTAVVQDDGRLNVNNLGYAIDSWSQNGKVNGKNLKVGDLTALIEAWSS